MPMAHDHPGRWNVYAVEDLPHACDASDVPALSAHEALKCTSGLAPIAQVPMA